MSRIIVDDHDGQVPSTREELMALPGVGRKVTDLILSFEFGVQTVGVDTHVHRLVNRLGMVRTSTHEQTADELMRVVPDAHQRHAHEVLIQHGMHVCRARSPRCDDCLLADLCQYAAENGRTG